jgi:mRNA interferase MazF
MVKRKGRYVPDRGDAIWITLDPQAGHKQAGRRPALVLSPAPYNGRIGLALVCPITSRIKGYPFEVAVPKGLRVGGVVLADQIKSLDWQARKASRICAVPEDVLVAVMRRLQVLLPNIP